MDIATIIGLVVGSGLILAAMGSNVSSFIDVPSMFIVIGGGIAATMISLPLKSLMGFPKVVRNAFFAKKESLLELVTDMVKYGEIARRDGILALEGIMEQITDPFLNRGIQLAVDGNDPEVISETLATEIDSVEERHANGKKMLDLLGKYAPAFGMIGTLVGLILMLQNLSDPSSIAPNMAIALLTTLYGALLANLVALPLADKLEKRNVDEILRMTVVKEGVIAIQSGDNPKVVEQKLSIFLPPSERQAA